MKVLDDQQKRLSWWNRNYFYAGTLAVVLFNVVMFGKYGLSWGPSTERGNWTDVLNFHNLLAHFVSAFRHFNWQHCLLNMLCFSVVGTYLERRVGTINLLALVLIFASFGEWTVAANSLSESAGFSGVNYALYAYSIVDYAFTFRKSSRGNRIYGALIIALIYFAMCFNGGTSTIGFEWYPYDFMTNQGHYSAFLAGLGITLFAKVCKIQAVRERVI